MMALQEKCIRGTIMAWCPNIDFPRLVNLYMDGRLKVDELVSRTYPLEAINEGFKYLTSGRWPAAWWSSTEGGAVTTAPRPPG